MSVSNSSLSAKYPTPFANSSGSSNALRGSASRNRYVVLDQLVANNNNNNNKDQSKYSPLNVSRIWLFTLHLISVYFLIIASIMIRCHSFSKQRLGAIGICLLISAAKLVRFSGSYTFHRFGRNLTRVNKYSLQKSQTLFENKISSGDKQVLQISFAFVPFLPPRALVTANSLRAADNCLFK